MIPRDIGDRGKVYVGQLVGGVQADPRKRLIYSGKIRGDEDFMVNTTALPRSLQPGEYFIEACHDSSIVGRRAAVVTRNPQALWAIDSLGKHWEVPRKTLRRLLHDDRGERGENKR
jgi:hypothetical protein